MARINYVERGALKDQGTCDFPGCGKEIVKGDKYKWFKPRYGFKHSRHLDHPNWKPSEMSSSKMVTVYAAQEAFESGKPYESPDDYATAMKDVAEAAREVGGEYTESADNIEQYFPSSDKADELREMGDNLEGWASDIDSAADTIESLDIECAECSQTEEDGPHHEFEEPKDVDPTDDAIDECAVQGCGESESEHHDFDDSGWIDEADSEASVMDDLPV